MVQIAGCGERWTRVELERAEDWGTAVDALSQAVELFARSGASLRWLDESCALSVESSGERAPAIRVTGLTLVILDNDERLMKTMPLGGALKADVLDWLSSQGIPPGDRPSEAAALPAPEEGVLVNLARTFSNAYQVLGQIARMTHGAEPVQTEPATLETCTRILLGTRSGESPRSIEVGFSPSEGQGAFFVRTQCEDPSAPEAVLSLAEVAKESDGDVQARVIETFLGKAIEEAYGRLSREWRPRTLPPT